MEIGNLTDFLSQVPDVVWSGVIASVLTLSGVLISNASNTARLKAQLAHDASEKAKERTGKLRQEVYLLVAEEMGNANAVLGSMGSMDFGENNPLDKMRGLFSAASKLQLVAEPSTAFLVNDLSSRYGALTLRMLAASAPLRETRIKIGVIQTVKDEANEQVQRYANTITEMMDSGQVDHNAYKHFEKQLNFHTTKVDGYDMELQQLLAKQVDQQLDFAKTVVSEMKPLSEQYAVAITAIRGDLGLSSETAAFKEQMMKQWTLMEKEMGTTLQALQENAEQKPS